MKVISFSLWGDDPKYNRGAIENAKLAKEIFPDWQFRLYVGQSVPWQTYAFISDTIYTEGSRVINSLGGIQMDCENPKFLLRHMPEDGDWTGMFWRFQPAYEPDVEAMISRDCDSRLSLREKTAVDEWLKSDKKFHCMRDHIWHNRPILGGMWGAKQGFLPNFQELMESATKEDRWQTDQDFLNDTIWPLVKDDTMQHDSFWRHLWGGKPFPVTRFNNEFIGEIFDADNKPNLEHRSMINGMV